MKTILPIKNKIRIDGKIPIVIGITGHRNIPESELKTISAQLEQTFQTLKQQFPNTPLLLLSPLAEGADQLTAHVASEHGIAVHAVLPMLQSEYEKDFAIEKNKHQFASLVEKSGYKTVLTQYDANSQRDLCYAHVGKWIVDQSDLLIAIWDGTLKTKTGGTGEVVNYALSGEFPSLENTLEDQHWIVSKAPVLHIQATNKSIANQGKGNDLEQEIRLYQHLNDLTSSEKNAGLKSLKHQQILHAINNFNTEISRSSLDGYPLLNSDESDLPENLQFIHQLYLKSDLVANRYQSTLRRYTILFYALTTGLLVTLVMYFKIFPLSIVIGLYLVLYIVTMLVSAKIRNSDYQKKYHLFRMVGEVSRLFFFSGLSGTTKNKPNSVLDDHRELQYLTRKIGTGNTWIINALKKISLFDNNDSATDAKVLNSPMDLIKTHWIEDQYRYFNKALKRDEAKLNTLNWIGSILFLISFLSGLCLFSLNYLDHSLPQIVKPVLSALIGISAGLGGILRSFSFTMGYSEITGQYRMMSDLFEDALLRMNNEHSNKNAVFEQLWWEALMENVEWFSLKNSRLINTFDLKKSLEGLIRLSKI